MVTCRHSRGRVYDHCNLLWIGTYLEIKSFNQRKTSRSQAGMRQGCGPTLCMPGAIREHWISHIQVSDPRPSYRGGGSLVPHASVQTSEVCSHQGSPLGS